MKKTELSKILFHTLIALIPLNLGKHFEYSGSYVYGRLVDYLVPTLYIQDIVAVGLLLSLAFEGKKIKLGGPVKKTGVLLILLFLSSVFSSRVLPSVWFVLRVFLYFILAGYAYYYLDLKKDLPVIKKILTVQFLFISMLSVAQYLFKGSIFNNYLFFGEQPYNISTPDITREVFLGQAVLPPMGLFRHPNVLAGYLSVMIVFSLFWFSRSRLNRVSLFFGIIALFLTFSYFTEGALFLTLLLNRVLRDKKKIMYLYLLFSALVLLTPFFYPYLKNSLLSQNPSFYRRSSLLEAAYTISGEFFLLGIGANNFTSYVDDYQLSRDFRFTQPVHNVPALILAESGFAAFAVFTLLFFYSYKKSFSSSTLAIFLVLSLVLLLISFDHYFWTAHQMLLMFFFLLGMSWKLSIDKES